MTKIYTFDTTLRDGEQSPGVNLNTAEKVEIALQLERLGVDVIEAGFAAASPGDLEAVRAVARAVKGSTVLSLCRSNREDIDAGWEAVKDAENPALHVFLATSPIHREKKLFMTKEQVLEQAVESVKYAKKYVDYVEFSCEDGSRTEIDFLVEVVTKVIEAGATVINIPDTVGYATPAEYAAIFRQLQERVPNIDKVRLSCHCHDDLGMAVANSLAAIEAGVRQVEGCINGIGERAGNVALEEVVMALETRYDFYKARASWNLKEIARTSKLVSRMTGMMVPANKAIVGANAFAHEAGIHQDGVLKDKATYEIMKPETIGVGESKLVMGKHSGRHAFKEKLIELGYNFDAEQINVLFKKFKDLADRKKTIVDADILALVEEKVSTQETYYELEGIQLSYSNQMVPTAVVHLNGKSGRLEETATGNGSVDAIFRAIDKAVAEVVELVDYRIVSVTHGKDALGEVHLKLQQNELIVQGRGVSTDILEASAKAYVDALNRLLNRKQTGQGGRKNLSISFG